MTWCRKAAFWCTHRISHEKKKWKNDHIKGKFNMHFLCLNIFHFSIESITKIQNLLILIDTATQNS